MSTRKRRCRATLRIGDSALVHDELELDQGLASSATIDASLLQERARDKLEASMAKDASNFEGKKAQMLVRSLGCPSWRRLSAFESESKLSMQIEEYVVFRRWVEECQAALLASCLAQLRRPGRPSLPKQNRSDPVYTLPGSSATNLLLLICLCLIAKMLIRTSHWTTVPLGAGFTKEGESVVRRNSCAGKRTRFCWQAGMSVSCDCAEQLKEMTSPSISSQHR